MVLVQINRVQASLTHSLTGPLDRRRVVLGLRRGVFTCVGWKVTLCDPVRQVTLRSCEMEYHEKYELKAVLTVLTL